MVLFFLVSWCVFLGDFVERLETRGFWSGTPGSEPERGSGTPGRVSDNEGCLEGSRTTEMFRTLCLEQNRVWNAGSRTRKVSKLRGSNKRSRTKGCQWRGAGTKGGLEHRGRVIGHPRGLEQGGVSKKGFRTQSRDSNRRSRTNAKGLEQKGVSNKMGSWTPSLQQEGEDQEGVWNTRAGTKGREG